MPVETKITREVLIADVVFLIQCMRDWVNEGQSPQAVDLRNAFSTSVTLSFSDYLRFLRHFGYVSLNQQQSLSLTATGLSLAAETASSELDEQLGAFFDEQLATGFVEVETEDEQRAVLDAIAAEITPNPGQPALDLKRAMMPSGSSSHPGGLTTPPVSAYTAVETIGQGPHGRVMRGRHQTLQFEVALKELSDTSGESSLSVFAARAARELAAQARLRHPAVVAVHDFELGRTPRVVQEFCEGGNLRDWLGRTPRPTPQRVMLAFAQLLEGLAVAETHGISHGNIKAENVLFDRYGNAKLSDFGLSHLDSTSEPPNPREDLRALGVLFYEGLTGMPHGPTVPFASKAVPTIPAAMDWVIEKMTAENPSERYASAGEARQAMLAALANPIYGGAGVITVLSAVMTGS